MKNIWLLTKTMVKRYYFSILLAVFSAIMLCFILHAMGGLATDYSLSAVKLGVMDYDDSILSNDFKKYLTDKMEYELIENNSYDYLSAELLDKEISAIIEIPQDFYEQFSVGGSRNIIITTMDDYENAAFLEANLNSYLGSIQILSESADGNHEVFDQLLQDYNNETIHLKQTEAQNVDRKAIEEKGGFINSVGFYLLFIFALGFLISFMILNDRNSGIFHRIQVTPVKPIQYVIGSAMFGSLLCFIEIAIYCGYIAIRGINIGFDLWVLVLFMSLFSIFTVGFAVAAALAFRSKNAVSSIVVGFSTVGCIMGGAYFPLDLAPKGMQNMARVLPQFWFMDTFRTLQENPQTSIVPNLIIMILFTILTLLIGALLFSQNYNKG